MNPPMPRISVARLPPPTFMKEEWEVDSYGRIYSRELGPQEDLHVGSLRLVAYDARLIIVSFQNEVSLSAEFTKEPYYQSRKFYYHTRLEVVFVPDWAQKSLPADIRDSADYWASPESDDGFPPGARRYYHFFVSTHSFSQAVCVINGTCITLGAPHAASDCLKISIDSLCQNGRWGMVA